MSSHLLDLPFKEAKKKNNNNNKIKINGERLDLQKKLIVTPSQRRRFLPEER